MLRFLYLFLLSDPVTAQQVYSGAASETAFIGKESPGPQAYDQHGSGMGRQVSVMLCLVTCLLDGALPFDFPIEGCTAFGMLSSGDIRAPGAVVACLLQVLTVFHQLTGDLPWHLVAFHAEVLWGLRHSISNEMAAPVTVCLSNPLKGALPFVACMLPCDPMRVPWGMPWGSTWLPCGTAHPET